MSNREPLALAVSKLAIKPGELLVIKAPPGLTIAQTQDVIASVKATTDQMRRKGAIPQDAMVVILPGAFDIGYVRADEAEAFIEWGRDLETTLQQTGN